MKKCLLLALVLFFVVSNTQRADANSYLMTHERFVHMSQEDKNIVLIKTMELMVELESKYELETKTSGYSNKRFQKYVQIMQKLQNFVLSEAAAVEPVAQDPQFEALANNFSVLLEKLKPKGCIYGGYVSVMVSANGHNYCRHPFSVTARHSSHHKLINSSYLNKSGAQSCVGPSKITCNPVIFGYKQSKNKTPFCVATSGLANNSKNHNVSFECMRKALTEGADGSTDSKEERLKYLSGAMAYNKEAFDKVHHTIFKTCACGDAQGEGMSTAYVNYMKPHRTCFGMMNSIRNIKENECAADGTEVTDTGFATEWSDYFGNKKEFKFVEPAFSSDFDKNYASLISNEAIVKKLCETKAAPEPTALDVDNPQSVVTNECKTNCEYQEDKIFCAVTEIIQTTRTGGNESSEQVTEFKTATVEVSDENAQNASFTTKSGQTIECPITKPTPKPVVKEIDCSVSLVDDAEKKLINSSLVSDENVDELETIEWIGATVDTSDKTKASLPFTQEAIEVVANVIYKGRPAVKCVGTREALIIPDEEEEQKEEILSCTVSVIDDAEKKNILFTVTSAKADIESVTWNSATVDASDFKKASLVFTKDAVSVEADVKFKDQKTVKCKGTREAVVDTQEETKVESYKPNRQPLLQPQQLQQPQQPRIQLQNTRRLGVQ